jgi:dolichol-phosphate mannosyltransferase
MKLSIILPIYFEDRSAAATIREMVRRVAAVPLHKEILLVDDGSDVDITAILEGLDVLGLRHLRHDLHRGRGAAIQTGLSAMTGDVVVIQEADLAYDPQDWPRLLAPIVASQTQVVYGVRNFASQGWTLRLGNRLMASVTHLLYGVRLRDMATGVKMMTRRVAKGLRLESQRLGVEAELTAKILRQGYTILEVPLHTSARPDRGWDKARLAPALQGLPTLWALIRYRFWRPLPPSGAELQVVQSETTQSD